MHATLIWRRSLTWLAVGSLMLSLFGTSFKPGTAFATEISPLIINEINWAGSPEMPADQWVELYNQSATDYTLSGTLVFQAAIPDPETGIVSEVNVPIDSESGTFWQYGEKLTAPIVLQARSYFLIGNPGPTSTLSAPLDVLYYEPTVAYNLQNQAEHPTVFSLLQDTGGEVMAVLDTTQSGLNPAPFAGVAVGAGSQETASMARLLDHLTESPVADATVQTSWYSSQVVSSGYLDAAPYDQWGTPGMSNTDFGLAGNPVLSPAYSLSQVANSAMTVSGKAITAYGLNHTTVDVDLSPFQQGVEGSEPYLVTPRPAVKDVSLLHGQETAYSIQSALEPGRYVFVLTLDDTVNQVYSKSKVALSGEIEDQYMVLATAPTAVAAPVLTTTPPTYTNADTVTLSGTVGLDVKAVDVVRNGRFLKQLPVSAGQFSASLEVLANQVNQFGLVAVQPLPTLNSVVSMPTYTTVTSSTVAPNPVDLSKVKVAANAPGTADTILGLPGAATAGTFLNLYTDAALTGKLNQAPILIPADGSFPVQSLGDNRVSQVYLQLTNMVGLKSTVVMAVNQIAFEFSGKLNLYMVSATHNEVVVGWSAVTGAVNYRYKYAKMGESFGPSLPVCAGALACTTQLQISSLEADTTYTVAVDAVDAYGNETAFEQYSFRTTPAPVVEPVVTKTVKVLPTPTVTPEVVAEETTPTPSPTGEVKSTSDSNDPSRNWTPWIILLILVLIAAIATVGYFYWFGGASGEEAMAAIEAGQLAGALKKEEEEPDEVKSEVVKPTPKVPPLPKGKDKRW